MSVPLDVTSQPNRAASVRVLKDQGLWRTDLPGAGMSPAALTATLIGPGAVGAVLGYAVSKKKSGAAIGAVAGIVANALLWRAVFSNLENSNSFGMFAFRS